MEEDCLIIKERLYFITMIDDLIDFSSDRHLMQASFLYKCLP